nr:MAG TPA: hypothetical protein [Caudoviricetes sp.]
MNNIELRRLTRKSIEHSDRLMIYQDNENNEGNYVTIDDIQTALLNNLIVNIEEYQEITEQNNSYTIYFLNKPFSIINLTGSTTKNVYFNNLFEGCTGKILIFQNGNATLKFPDGIYGKADIPLEEGSIVLINYFILSRELYIYSTIIVGPSKSYAYQDLSNVDSNTLKTKVDMDSKANTDLSNVSNSVVVTKSGVESKANKTLDNVDSTIAMNKSSIYELEGSDQSYMALVYKISDSLYHSIGINTNGEPVAGTGNNLEEIFTEKCLLYRDLSNCLTIKAIDTSGLDTATDSNSIYLVHNSSSNVNGRYIMMVFKPYITSYDFVVQIRISTSGVIESRNKVANANWTNWKVDSDNRYLKLDFSNSNNLKLNTNNTIINSLNVSGNNITVIGSNNTNNKNHTIIVGKHNNIQHDNVISFGNNIIETIKEKCIHVKIDNLNIVKFSHVMSYPVNTLHNMVILFPPLNTTPLSIVIDCITTEYDSKHRVNRSGALRHIIVGMDENIYKVYDTTSGATSLEFHYSDTEGLYISGSDQEAYDLNLDITVKYED